VAARLNAKTGLSTRQKLRHLCVRFFLIVRHFWCKLLCGKLLLGKREWMRFQKNIHCINVGKSSRFHA